MKNHEILEKNVGLLAIFMVIAVSIGGLTQIVPLFFQDVTNTPVEGMKPRTDEPLSQIGVACGFSDQPHFSRIFLRLAGASPSTWRRVKRQRTDAAL